MLASSKVACCGHKGKGCRQTATHQVEILEQVGSLECVLNVFGVEMGCGVGENSKSDFYT